MTVLIAGAGIGGLTLGLSLHQLGIPFKIFEAVREIRPLGVGINVQPHAIRELFELGLEGELDKVGLRTKQVAYFSAQGGEIWREARGEFAGYHWPQYSIHRGGMQMLLYRALMERAGPDVIQMGAAVTGSVDTATGVEITLADRSTGETLGCAAGSVFVAADGINSAARQALYPDEGAAHWGGIMMWRGVTRGPSFLGGRTMAMAGKRDCKFVCYPIEEFNDGTCLINWIADRAMAEDYVWREQDWTVKGAWMTFWAFFLTGRLIGSMCLRSSPRRRVSGNIRWSTATHCRAGATGGCRFWGMRPMRCIRLDQMARRRRSLMRVCWRGSCATWGRASLHWSAMTRYGVRQ